MWEEPDDLQTKEGRGGMARISRAERFTQPTRKSSMWGVTGGREAELAAKQSTSDAPTALFLQTARIQRAYWEDLTVVAASRGGGRPQSPSSVLQQSLFL